MPPPTSYPSRSTRLLASDPFATNPPPTPPVTAPPVLDDFYRQLIQTYDRDPVGFAEDILGMHTLQQWQKDLMNKVAHGTRRISVRAGHGVGKSAACAITLVWFMVVKYPQKSVLTAPTAGQLFDALFSEVKLWMNRLPPPIRELFDLFSDKIVLRAAPEGSFMSARTSSSERPEALSGVHSDHVLLVCDEASAIPEPVFEAATGSMSGFSATTILISNPTRNTGLFFKTHHQLSQDWDRIHVSCLDSPLVSHDFVEQIASTYGETSNAYRIRVLGEFALRDDDALLSAELVDAAMSRDVVLDTRAPVIYGLDVARFGSDRTCLVKLQGQIVVDIKVWSGLDIMEVAGHVVHEARTDTPAEIRVDSVGLGAGVADRLRELGHSVFDINVGEASAFNPVAARKRDELWLNIKAWLETRTCKLPKNDLLRQELLGPTYTFLSNGRMKVESKDDMRRRGLRSPDMADALALALSGQEGLSGGRGTPWVKNKPLKRRILGIV